MSFWRCESASSCEESVGYLDVCSASGDSEVSNVFQVPLKARPAQTLSSGDVYTGQWMGRLRHGRGHLVQHGIGTYEGEFFRNKAHGKGRLARPCGDVYDGQFQENFESGEGKCTYADGSSHTGQWRMGEKAGAGK